MPIALFLDTAATFAKRYLKHLPFAAALCLAGFYYVQLNGFLWIDGARDKLAACEKARADILTASDASRKEQEAQVKLTEAKYEQAAKETNDAYNRGKADAVSAAERYIANNRVRQDQVYRSTPATPGEDHNPGSVEGPGAQTELVAVSAEDVRICSENTARLEAAREWAAKLVGAGLAN